MNRFMGRYINTHLRYIIVMSIAVIASVMVLSQKQLKAYAASVVMGHGTIGEKGKMVGTKAGDQSGREVCLMNYTYHKGGWSGWTFVARANEAEVAKKIAKSMEAVCKNDKVGYGKDGPSVFDAAKKVNYDLSKIKKKSNGDCFDIMGVCLYAAGIHISSPTALPYSDCFKIYRGKDYCTKSSKLQPGDILVTLNKKHRHVAVVVTSPNKSKGADPNPTSPYKKGTRYKVVDSTYTYRGPGGDYAMYGYEELSSSGRMIAKADTGYVSYFEGKNLAYIPADTIVTCLEARRKWIRTSAGWISGEAITLAP